MVCGSLHGVLPAKARTDGACLLAQPRQGEAEVLGAATPSPCRGQENHQKGGPGLAPHVRASQRGGLCHTLTQPPPAGLRPSHIPRGCFQGLPTSYLWNGCAPWALGESIRWPQHNGCCLQKTKCTRGLFSAARRPGPGTLKTACPRESSSVLQPLQGMGRAHHCFQGRKV